MRPDSLSDLQYDALREVGSIGAGHAATALSQLVDHRVELAVPTLDLLAVTDIPTVFGGAEQLVAAVYTRILGDLGGSVVFVLDRDSALGLVDLLRNRPIGTSRSLGPDEEAVISNAATILISAYLTSIGRLADLSVLPGSPALATDMVGAILQAIAAEIGMNADDALIIRTEFESDERDEGEPAIDVYLMFLPDEPSLATLLGRLGVV